MATREVVYIPYVEAVLVHIELMRDLGETHYGVFSRELVASALTRPQQAAAYENADLARNPANCDEKWTELVTRFRQGIDWSGLEAHQRIGWQHTPRHIFLYPLYFFKRAGL